jgi:thiol-disulfide isomerase/thioredoxin
MMKNNPDSILYRKNHIKINHNGLVVFLYIVFSLLCQKVVNAQSINAKKQLEQVIEVNQGKVVYLDFWASWCGPCRKSFPWMNAMQAKYQAQGFKVISINLDADKALAQQFLKKNKANFSVIYDPEGTIAKTFDIQGMPTSVLINKSGKIVIKHSGFFNNKVQQYQQEIEALIKE